MNEKWVDRGSYSKIMEGVAPETPVLVDFGEWELVRAEDFLPALTNTAVRQLASNLNAAVKALRGETKESETERVESLEPMTVDASLLPDFGVVGDIVTSPRTKKAVAGALVLSQLALASCGTVPQESRQSTASPPTKQETGVQTKPEPLPTYTVQAGDTFYSIAARFNIAVDRLMGLNGFDYQTARSLQTGTILKIPAAEAVVVEAAPAPPPPTPLSPQSPPDAQRQPLATLPERLNNNLTFIGNFPVEINPVGFSPEDVDVIELAFRQASAFISEHDVNPTDKADIGAGIVIEKVRKEWGHAAGYLPAKVFRDLFGDDRARVYAEGAENYRTHCPGIPPHKAMVPDLVHEMLHALGLGDEDDLFKQIEREAREHFSSVEEQRGLIIIPKDINSEGIEVFQYGWVQDKGRWRGGRVTKVENGQVTISLYDQETRDHEERVFPKDSVVDFLGQQVKSNSSGATGVVIGVAGCGGIFGECKDLYVEWLVDGGKEQVNPDDVTLVK